MIRVLDATLLTAAIACAIYTFHIKHEAELSAKRLATLKAQIAAQDRKIALLRADWALETAPGRLEKIAGRYSEQLMLRAMDSTQIIEIHELPDMRPPPSLEVDERLADEAAPLTTGGIEKLIERAIEN